MFDSYFQPKIIVSKKIKSKFKQKQSRSFSEHLSNYRDALIKEDRSWSYGMRPIREYMVGRKDSRTQSTVTMLLKCIACCWVECSVEIGSMDKAYRMQHIEYNFRKSSFIQYEHESNDVNDDQLQQTGFFLIMRLMPKFSFDAVVFRWTLTHSLTKAHTYTSSSMNRNNAQLHIDRNGSKK